MRISFYLSLILPNYNLFPFIFDSWTYTMAKPLLKVLTRNIKNGLLFLNVVCLYYCGVYLANSWVILIGIP